VDQTQNVLVIDFLVSGDACLGDTLERLTVTNLGTAGAQQIDRFVLWRDDGDGAFDPIADASIGAFELTASKTYEVEDLSEPIAGIPGSRFFITMDIPTNVETGGTVHLAIPLMGIGVASGNDGPLDGEIIAPGIFTIPVPDRVTCFASLLGNKRVRPGDTQALNLVLGMYNSYKQSKTLTGLTLMSIGSSRPTEILKVEAYADSDENGLFDPPNDSLIGVAESSATGYSFEDLGTTLKPYRSTLLFIAYETAIAGIRDSVLIDLQVSDKSSIELSGNPKIEGQFPLNSAGDDVTDGMVSAQIRMLAVPDERVSPGAADVPCLSLVLPSNGTSADVPDVLQSMSIQNSGTASEGQDIRYVKLWKDTGSTQFVFDSGDDFMAFLVWDGSSWRTFTPIAESIPSDGLALHVTVDIASTAQDGRSVSLCLPVGGALVSSGNDGPIDARVCSTAGIEITTDPLLTSFTVPAAVTRDQIFEVRMIAANVGDTMLVGVMPDSFEYAGTGSCTLISGPIPASIDLAEDSDSSFAWTFSAQSTGEIVFRGRAREEMGPESSRMELSDTIAVEEIPENITVVTRDLAPVSLNRGRDDVSLVEMVIAYNPASGLGASVELKSIDLLVASGAGASLPAEDVFSRMRLRDESRVLCSVATDTISQPVVSCALPEPVILHPGDSKTFRISVDIPLEPAASNFRLSISSSDKINLADHNGGAAVPFTGTAFPWWTGAVTLQDPANALLVELVSTAPARVNTGQEDVEAFDLILENGGGASTAPVSVSEIVLTAMDATGDTIDAGNLFKTFRLADSDGNTHAYLETFAGSASIRCSVQPAIAIASGVPVTLHAVIDCLLEPGATGFSISLHDSLDLAARDANSGQPVEVRAAGGSSGFPMITDTSHFSHPLVSVMVGGRGLMEKRIVAGTTNAAALRLILTHPGAAQESPFSCGGITLRLLDELGSPLAPIDVLAAVRVLKGTAEEASVYINALHGSDISLPFASPLVTSPGEADTLDVLFDLKAAPGRSRFQMQVNAAGIDITDATDGRSGIPLAGSFPVASGLGMIVFPAGEVLFDAAGLLPPNMTADAETDCMRLAFTRGNESSGSMVFVDGFAFEVLDEDDQAVDPSLVISTLRIHDESGEIVSNSQVADGGIVVSFVDPIAVRENETRSFVLAITSTEGPPVKAMSLRIVSGDAILCRDEATGEGVSVVASPGEFPFGSGKTVILSRNVEAAFSNYPNPFIAGNEVTRITFYMPGEGRASVKVFTIPGELVRTIIENESLAAGLHQEFSWDGKNGSGNTVLNGVYYLVLKISAGGREYTFKRKVALVQ
ncbi:MAG: hypothetical protein PHD74_00555, partial [Candidatus Krumholzibacteria bacterium]|nr:hypothetical protein [Candidatus Krumholzibacteria bacterium]